MADVTIRAISRDDTDNIVRWRNLPQVRKNLFSQAEVTRDGHLKYMETMVDTGKCRQFIIEADGHPCGTVFLKNVDLDKKEAEFGIFIGEADCRGKGIGTLAAKQILKYGFEILGLEKIQLYVFSDNTAAIHSYQRVGFKSEGTFSHCRDGVNMEVTEMSITRGEFND